MTALLTSCLRMAPDLMFQGMCSERLWKSGALFCLGQNRAASLLVLAKEMFRPMGFFRLQKRFYAEGMYSLKIGKREHEQFELTINIST